MSSRPSSISAAMRDPVTSKRRCEQITALGADDVPLVKMSAHGDSSGPSACGSSPPAASSAASSSSPTARLCSIRSSTPSTSPAWRGSWINSEQSVWEMSWRRCSPPRVWLTPTTAPPARAAPPNANRYSGVLSNSTAMWSGRPSRRYRPNRFAHRHDSAKYSAWVQIRSPKRMAGASARSGSVALARSSSAAFGAGSGASPSFGADATDRDDMLKPLGRSAAHDMTPMSGPVLCAGMRV